MWKVLCFAISDLSLLLWNKKCLQWRTNENFLTTALELEQTFLSAERTVIDKLSVYCIDYTDIEAQLLSQMASSHRCHMSVMTSQITGQSTVCSLVFHAKNENKITAILGLNPLLNKLWRSPCAHVWLAHGLHKYTSLTLLEQLREILLRIYWRV